MLFGVSFLVVAAVAAFTVSQINFNSSKKRKLSINHSEKDASSFQQYGEEEDKFKDNFGEAKMVERKMKPNLMRSEEVKCNRKRRNLGNLTDTEHIQSLIKKLEQRKLALEGKLLQLYDLKEQKSYITQLRRHLEDNRGEIQAFNIRISSLKAEIMDLQEEIKQGIIAEKELKIAKKMIDEMQKKIDANGSQMKRQITMLEEQVSGFRSNDTSTRDTKLKAVKDIELQVVGIRRRNKELELEKRESALKLVVAHAKVTALTNTTESEVIAKVEEDASVLRHANEELSKQVEKLQKERFNMVEELVYQRWLNACLRFEVQNYQTPSRRASIDDLDKNTKQKTREETKQLTLDPIFDSVSSTETDDIDSSFIESSSSSQRSIRKKYSSVGIKRWGRSKYESIASSRNALVRRFSTSMIPSKPAASRNKQMQDCTEFTGKSRARRVSFNDAVETIRYTPKLLDDKGTVDEMLSENSTTNASNSSGKPDNKNHVDSQVLSRIEDELHSEIANDLHSENKVETHMVHLIAAFIFFILIIFIFVCLITAGIY